MLTATHHGLDNSTALPDDDLIGEVRTSLRALTASFDPKTNQAYTLSLMATLFYDIEGALDAGATLRQVHQLITSKGVPLPYTRFCQDLTRLKQIFPARKKEPEIDSALVTSLKDSIAELEQSQLPLPHKITPDASAETKDIARHKARVARRQLAQPPVPSIEKVKICARTVVEIARAKDADVPAITARMRKVLGPSWTPVTACQFVAGDRYAQWIKAPWSKADRPIVTQARSIVMKIVDEHNRIKSSENLQQLLNLAWDQIQ